EVDGVIASVRALEEAEGVTADDADRADLDDAATLGGDREELLRLLARREPLDAELAAASADRQHDARRQDRPAAGVRQRERADRAFSDDDPGAGEVEGDVVLGAADEEQRAQDQRERDDDSGEGQLAPAQTDP